MKIRNHYRIRSQMDFPFLESRYEHLKDIFETLNLKFGLKKNSNQKLIDLGAGDGRIIIYSALKYGIHSLGIEISKNLVENIQEQKKVFYKEKKYSKRNINKIEIREGDLFELNLKKYDFIYMFILPSIQKYLKHLILTMKKDAIIISYKYTLDYFDEFIHLEHEIEHEDKFQQFSTFFYRKI